MKHAVIRSAFRELEPFEIELVSGGWGEGDEPDPGEEIVVTGHLEESVYVGEDYASQTAQDEETGAWGATGVLASQTPGVQTFTHNQDCSSASGAATQAASHVMGTNGFSKLSASDGSTYDGTTSGHSLAGVEFSALIVHNSNGSYGTWENEVWTSDSQFGSFVPTAFPGHAVGLWHSHPDRGDDALDKLDAFPSKDDWDVLNDLHNSLSGVVANYDPSLWVTDPNGVTREFKWSERSNYDGPGITNSYLQQNFAALTAGKERAPACGA